MGHTTPMCLFYVSYHDTSRTASRRRQTAATAVCTRQDLNSPAVLPQQQNQELQVAMERMLTIHATRGVAADDSNARTQPT